MLLILRVSALLRESAALSSKMSSNLLKIHLHGEEGRQKKCPASCAGLLFLSVRRAAVVQLGLE